MNDREQKIADAREMLAFLEENPDIPLPHSIGDMSVYPKTVSEFLTLITNTSIEGKFRTFGKYFVVTPAPGFDITLRPEVWQAADLTHGTLLTDEPTDERCAHGLVVSERVPTKIRVTSSKMDVWYEERVGDEFTVLHEFADSYSVPYKSSPSAEARIDKCHAEIIAWSDDINEAGF